MDHEEERDETVAGEKGAAGESTSTADGSEAGEVGTGEAEASTAVADASTDAEESADDVEEVEVATYHITGLVDYTDEQGNIVGQLPIDTDQELPVSVGDAAVADGRATRVE